MKFHFTLLLFFAIFLTCDFSEEQFNFALKRIQNYISNDLLEKNELKKTFKDLENLIKSVLIPIYFKDPMKETNKMKYDLYFKNLKETITTLARIFLNYKKKDQNTPWYEKYKNNIQLLLEKFWGSTSNFWCYFVYGAIFLSGIGISYTSFYFLKKK
ncbi:hypothetical protein TUBRATIS_27620 [Tubulinosema ratisbonensis]|uniref:Uncharacterized protein n=1 Tax=Tubulinosema ratisbonensis TaxID=291195 RepID=A0A437AI04_9MICR|nr:hypothetical protein TUBRATIS_27620 [Tubulinosema ratisbonensis]